LRTTKASGSTTTPARRQQQFFDGKYVTGCVGVQLEGGPFSTLVVRARSVASACGNACAAGDAGCGTGDVFGVFQKTSPDPTWIATVAITSDFADHPLTLPPSVGASPSLVVCRSSASPERDDVEVDFVGACP